MNKTQPKRWCKILESAYAKENDLVGLFGNITGEKKSGLLIVRVENVGEYQFKPTEIREVEQNVTHNSH